jgi:hypothetical protein
MEEIKLKKRKLDRDGHYPISLKGDMLMQARLDCNWKPLGEFYAKMCFVEFQTYNSAMRIILKDENGKKFSLMRASFNSFMSRAVLGRLPATYVAVKRGIYYGLLLKEDL